MWDRKKNGSKLYVVNCNSRCTPIMGYYIVKDMDVVNWMMNEIILGYMFDLEFTKNNNIGIWSGTEYLQELYYILKDQMWIHELWDMRIKDEKNKWASLLSDYVIVEKR